jgi:serine/threonine protein kinase/regulator of sirC expression with transglutaminase-like and TPR domain
MQRYTGPARAFPVAHDSRTIKSMSMRESVARYRIVSTLGRGSMGLVYLAEDPLLNRQVAIKMVDLADSGSKREESRERLLRDAKAVANLSHPNIVNVHDVIEEADSAFIVMEYIEGDTLASYLSQLPVPEPHFSIQVLRQMAAGLDYAHSKGVVHRDIKPGNVMLGPSGMAKIVDFGIARMNNAQTSTPTGFVMGTAAYMAPEQFTGTSVDGRADQYSLAAVGYEMMAGGTLFGDQPLPVLAYKAVHEMPPAVNTRNPAVPSSVNDALTKALAKSPAARYTTCVEFVDALAHAISNSAVPSRVAVVYPSPGATQTTASGKRSTSGWWVACLAGLVLIGGGLALWKPWSPPVQSVALKTTTPVTRQIVEPPAKTGSATVSPDLNASNPHKDPIAKPVSIPPPAVKAELHKESPPPTSTSESIVETEKAKAAKTPDVVVAGKERPVVAEEYRRGQEQLKAREFQAAIQSFSNVISQQPKRAQAYFSRGQAHQLLGENEAAIKDYDQAIRFKPEDALAHVERGICLVRLRRDDEAFADYNRALEIRADLPAALNGRGGILLRRRQFENAIKDFTAALALNPHFVQAYRNRAAARQALGDIAGARADRKAAGAEKNGEP